MNKEWYFVIASVIWAFMFPGLIILEKVTKGNTLLWNYWVYKQSPTGNATPTLLLTILILILGAMSFICIVKYERATRSRK